jgi:hypothetical protein
LIKINECGLFSFSRDVRKHQSRCGRPFHCRDMRSGARGRVPLGPKAAANLLSFGMAWIMASQRAGSIGIIQLP